MAPEQQAFIELTTFLATVLFALTIFLVVMMLIYGASFVLSKYVFPYFSPKVRKMRTILKNNDVKEEFYPARGYTVTLLYGEEWFYQKNFFGRKVGGGERVYFDGMRNQEFLERYLKKRSVQTEKKKENKTLKAIMDSTKPSKNL